MNRRRVAFTLAVASSLVPSPAARGDSASEEIRNRLVHIEVTDDGGTLRCGVGFFLDREHVLTAAHVLGAEDLEGESRFRLRTLKRPVPVEVSVHDGTTAVLRLPKPQDHLDVAILKIADEAFPEIPADVARVGRLKAGQILEQPAGFVASYHVGSCHSGEQLVAPGLAFRNTLMNAPELAKVHGTNTQRMSINPGLLDGYSGSPLVSKAHEAVVGVYTAGQQSGSLGYATSLDQPEVVGLIARSLGVEPRPLDGGQGWYPRNRHALEALIEGSGPDELAAFRRANFFVGWSTFFERGAGFVFPPQLPTFAFGLRLAPALVGGFHHRAFLGPEGLGNKGPLEERRREYLGAVLEIGPAVRLFRLSPVNVEIAAVARGGLVAEFAPLEPSWILGSHGRLRLAIRGDGRGVAVDVTAGVSVQPGITRRYSGFEKEATTDGRRRESLFGAGVAYLY